MKVMFSILLLCLIFIGKDQTDQKSTPPDNKVIASLDGSTTNVIDSLINAQVAANTSSNNASKKAKAVTGIASMYSAKLEGTETSTGETFSHKYLTAASNNFKLNTLVKVTNLRTGKSVVVRINDRMHPAMAAKGRVVDLSLSAAKQIGLTVLAGLTKVKVEVVKAATGVMR
jgi:rare lipoprotein A